MLRLVTCRALHFSVARMGFKPGRGTGDKGKSSLFNNERRWKDDVVFQALGSTDELSSWLGLCREQALVDKLQDVADVLTTLQCIIQDLGSHIATPPNSSEKKLQRTTFDESFVKFVHSEIDVYGDQVPPLKQFILAGGGELGARLQYGRTLARRTERQLIDLMRDAVIDDNAVKFVNRLSDLLFVMGRYATLKTGGVEAKYTTPTTLVRTLETIQIDRKKLASDKEDAK